MNDSGIEKTVVSGFKRDLGVVCAFSKLYCLKMRFLLKEIYKDIQKSQKRSDIKLIRYPNISNTIHICLFISFFLFKCLKMLGMEKILM